MSINTRNSPARRALESLGLEQFAQRKDGESDLAYIEAVLTARGLGYVKRQGALGELLLVLWNGRPTIEMIAVGFSSVHDMPTHALMGRGLPVFEFWEDALESY